MKTELVVLLSVLFNFLVVLKSGYEKKRGKEDFGHGVLWIFIFIMFAAFWDGDIFLKKSFLFGISVLPGIIAMDKFLLLHTLIYGGYDLRIGKTPWWMCLQWAVVLTQLSYFWFYLEPRSFWYFDLSSLGAYFAFFISGSLLFYVIEYIVCNHTIWWERRNCNQPNGVANYVTISECATVAVIPPFCAVIAAVSFFGTILLGLLAGFVINYIFKNCCMYSMYNRP